MNKNAVDKMKRKNFEGRRTMERTDAPAYLKHTTLYAYLSEKKGAWD